MKRKKQQDSEQHEQPLRAKKKKNHNDNVPEVLNISKKTSKKNLVIKAEIKEEIPDISEPLKRKRDKLVKSDININRNGQSVDDIQDVEMESQLPKKTKKKVRIDETESLKIKKEMADTEPHFSTKELPAKIIKSKMNKALTEDVKVSPVTVQSPQVHMGIASKAVHNGSKEEEESSTTEDSDLEVYYINKNAEKEAKQKEKESIPKKHSIFMPKEDQDLLVQRIQDCIPENDTKSYKYRVTQIEWAKVAFKNYSVEDCQKVWAQLLKKVRHYRLLIEITHDVRQVIENIDLKAQSKHPKTSTKKHPDMPKRPLSSYFLFYIRKKDKIAKEHPEADVTELNKYISEKYYSLPLEKKQKYDGLAAKNREKYKKDMEEFYVKHPEFRKTIKKEPKIKKEKPPNKPETPYRLYMLAELNKEPIDEQYKTEFKELCREKWKQMPDGKKLVWINLAEEHLLKYNEELKSYMARYPEYIPKLPTKPFLSREELNLKDKLAGKPKKPPTTAYSLFMSTVMQSEEIANIPIKERMNYCSVKWKHMNDEEKDQYRTQLIDINVQYQEKFKAYLDSLPEDKRQAEILLNAPKKKVPEKSSSSKKKHSTKKSSGLTKKKKSPPKKKVLVNPTPPPRSMYKYFLEKYEGDNPKEAWKTLDPNEKEKYEKELTTLKDKYIKDFEAYLKSLTKEELAVFSASRKQQSNEESSSEESDSESEDSSDESSENEGSDTDEN
ncbi:nucleolar transcription factor 1-like [Sitophilus oryzae]|uniref:Nucleolar transcription factor 1-like n=1 Tax=Sitophilus oryzae TaxID=7048 RepID=A0A6J2XB88_SITOR|nr:nucleolar transcription factor 1-like [Sitophilus oryzae]